MREILFRGKTFDGEWEEGSLHIEYGETTADGKRSLDYRILGMRGECRYVDPNTVGQYTGLTDKNGKKIFEGDIVRCGTGRICVVMYFTSPSECGFDLYPINRFDAPPPIKWKLFADTEVIGNVHDNKEPAVDAVEVKHGHWQEYEDYCLDVYYDCSVCGGTFYMADGTPTENGYNFCPKCGARMGETIRVELENDEID